MKTKHARTRGIGLMLIACMTAATLSCLDAETTKNTGSGKISAPGGVSATQGLYPTSIIVTWNAVTGASMYKVYRATAATGTYTYIGYSTATNVINSTKSPASYPITSYTYYYYKITAVDASSVESDYSSYAYGYSAIKSTEAAVKIINSSSIYTITEFRLTTGSSEPSCSYSTPSSYGSNLLTSSIAVNSFTWCYFTAGVYVDWYLKDSGNYYIYDDQSTSYGSHYFIIGDCYTIICRGGSAGGTYYPDEEFASIENSADSQPIPQETDYSLYYIPERGFVQAYELKQ